MNRSLITLRLMVVALCHIPTKAFNFLLLILVISLASTNVQAHSLISLSTIISDGISNDDKASTLALLSFSGKSNTLGNHLVWQIPNPISRKDFEVERSSNGRDWKSIGTIANHSENLYEALDANPMNGTNHYRIKQTDGAGRFHYSRVIKIYWNK